MNEKVKKSILLRITNSICAFALLGAVIYMVFAGFQAAALGVLFLSLAGIAGPVVASGEGLFEILAGVVEAIFEGIAAVFSAIADAIGGLFG